MILSAVRRPISNSRIYSSIMNDNNNLSERLYDSMISCGWSDIDIKGWKYILNKRNSIKSFIKKFSPLLYIQGKFTSNHLGFIITGKFFYLSKSQIHYYNMTKKTKRILPYSFTWQLSSLC